MCNKWDDTDSYLVTPDKVPSEEEPIDLRLSEEERLTRLVRHRGVDSMMVAIRSELMDLEEEEMDVRTWLMRHTNEVWRRGNGE